MPVRIVEHAVALRERPAGAQRRIEQLRGARAGRGHVDVRVGAIGNEAVAAPHHRPRDVRVEIEARDDRHARPDGAADAREQLALAVVEMLGHHRAVEVEVNAVERAFRLEPPHDLAGDPLVRVARHVRRRARGRPREPGAGMPHRGQLTERAGRRDVGPVHRGRDRGAEAHARPAAALLECFIPGLARREGIGLVLEPADRDARHPCDPSWSL